MIKKSLLTVMVALLATISTFAQQQDSALVAHRYGVVSYSKVLQSMPEYRDMQQALDNRKTQFDAEMKRAADEFNDKYDTFLSEQKTYAPSILRKHQSELEDLISHNEQFKKECQQELESLRQTLLAPITDRLQETLQRVSEEHHFPFILNTDNNAVPYINPQETLDITDELITTLNPNPNDH